MLGRNHPLLRQIRSLRRDADLRRSEGLLVAEGLHLAEEALGSGAAVDLALVSAGLRDRSGGSALLDSFRQHGVPVHETAPRWLDALQDARSPQPVLTLVRWRPEDLDELTRALPAGALVVLAHGIQDPGNLGSVMRSADAAGASALVVCGETADPSHPRTVRATAGSLFRLAVARAGSREAVVGLRDRGFRIIGSAPAAVRPYEEIDWSGSIALLLGSEGSGLPSELLDGVDETVGIPMKSGVESLSVGAAAAVLLFAAARQRNR